MKKFYFFTLILLTALIQVVHAGEWLKCKKQQVRNATIDCSKYENRGQNTNKPKSSIAKPKTPTQNDQK